MLSMNSLTPATLMPTRPTENPRPNEASLPRSRPISSLGESDYQMSRIVFSLILSVVVTAGESFFPSLTENMNW